LLCAPVIAPGFSGWTDRFLLQQRYYLDYTNPYKSWHFRQQITSISWNQVCFGSPNTQK